MLPYSQAFLMLDQIKRNVTNTNGLKYYIASLFNHSYYL